MKQNSKTQKQLKEFVRLARDILRSEDFRKMKQYRHHVRGNLYEHSVKVAYLCYRYHRRFGLKIDASNLVRGALLHDYYLYDLHDGASHRLHWYRHPKRALENAQSKYPNLTAAEHDMIKRHMFPLTPIPPKTGAGWLVCFFDKVAAISDRFTKSNTRVQVNGKIQGIEYGSGLKQERR